MAFGGFKDLGKRKASDIKLLRDKIFHIAKDTEYDGYKRGLAYIVHNFFDKKSVGCIKVY